MGLERSPDLPGRDEDCPLLHRFGLSSALSLPGEWLYGELIAGQARTAGHRISVNFASIAFCIAARNAGHGHPPSARGEPQAGIATGTRAGGESSVTGSSRRIWSSHGGHKLQLHKRRRPALSAPQKKRSVPTPWCIVGGLSRDPPGEVRTFPQRLERSLSCPARIANAPPRRPKRSRGGPARRGLLQQTRVCAPTGSIPGRAPDTACAAPGWA